MFENNPSLIPKQLLKESELCKLKAFPKKGIEAFEIGLDEVECFNF
jgi:hypothetical protein